MQHVYDQATSVLGFFLQFRSHPPGCTWIIESHMVRIVDDFLGYHPDREIGEAEVLEVGLSIIPGTAKLH